MKIALLAVLITAGGLAAQVQELAEEKRLFLKALDDLGGALERLVPKPKLDDVAVFSIRQVEYFHLTATKWQPKREDEGRGLRISLEAIAEVVRNLPEDPTAARKIMVAVAEDLGDKKDLCLAHGLDAKVQVEIRPKRRGLGEVRGLEVWYVEKFLASDPAAAGHRFPGFSSPVDDVIVPGRYLFWSKDPESDRNGQRVEQRVSVGGGNPATLKIEVLAP